MGSTSLADLRATTRIATCNDFLDTSGCLLGCSGAPGIAELVRVVGGWGGTAQSQVMLWQRRLPAPHAAMMNASKEWFEAAACDGFNITPATLPAGGEDFVEIVVPELQRRGLFRTEYEGRTLRENLGLRSVINRYSRNRRTAK
jgi:hypothetical protein